MQFITPFSRQIIQRSNSNAAVVSFTGVYATSPSKIQVRLVPIRDGQGTATTWQYVSFSGGRFSGKITARGGWYRLEAQALTSYDVAQETAVVDRVGVGEVFVIAGHSVAQGGDTYINGAADDRVNTIPLDTPVDQTQHVKTGKLDDMPTIRFVQFGTGVRPAPFGPNCYFWSRFGELLAQRINVPVLIYQTAFGGTNLEQWANSSQGIPFPLFSVNPNIGLPYVNLKHTLQKYAVLTGLRAILIDHGQNDYRELNEEVLLTRYLTFVNQARADAMQPNLPAVINRQTPFLTVDAKYQGDAPMTHVRRVQERMAKTPNCFAGPDYDLGLTVSDRYDYIHLNESGQAKAAKLWADALTDSFFKQSVPYLLEPVVDLPDVSDLTSGLTTQTVQTASILPDLSKLQNWALIALFVLLIGFAAFLLHQYYNHD